MSVNTPSRQVKDTLPQKTNMEPENDNFQVQNLQRRPPFSGSEALFVFGGFFPGDRWEWGPLCTQKKEG